MKILLLLTALLNSECLDCSISEQEKIISVVLNRARINNMTVEEVIMMENQFSGVCTENFVPNPALNDVVMRIFLSGPVDSAITFFFLKGCPHKKWMHNIKILYEEGNHFFAKEKKL